MKRAEEDFVVVGLATIGGGAAILSRLELRLSREDRERAGRFRRLEDRARFVVGRALLARLFGDELGYRPEVLDLALTEQGRPFLASFPDVRFSISHAGEWVGVALAVGAEVGLDLEALDRRIDLDSLAERIFDSADLARFLALPEEAKPGAFFRAWTGKEAVLKAKGLGLFGGVREINAPLDDESAVLKDAVQPGLAWHVRPLVVAGGYVASWACDRPWPLRSPRFFTIEELA